VPGLYGEAHVNGWKAVTDAVHAAGGKIVTQLWHVGRISHTDLQPKNGAPVAPSAIRAKAKTVLIKDGAPVFVETSEPRALDATELPGIVHDYVLAARHAIHAGFDGVEIHAANGYLLDQFMKTGSNHRTDDYGGDRTGIRLSPVTPANDAFDGDPQTLFDYVAHHLATMDLAYIHVIEGSTGADRVLPDRPFDYASFKAVYRAGGGKGAWMVNNAYDAAMAASAVPKDADLVAFGRPFIANPDLVARIATGAAWQTLDRKTLYGGGAAGYIDYPTM
jgi:N-ethylmaleimide reductase